MSEVRYLDLDILINGGMDAFILVVTARLLHLPILPLRILCSVLLGEIPVVLSAYPLPEWSALSRFIVPFLMIKVAFKLEGPKIFFKVLTGFWLLSAGLGGFIYALWAWTQFNDSANARMIRIGLENLWFLPIAAALWLGTQHLWERWQVKSLVLSKNIFEVEIDFGEDGDVISVKALMDTGNHLQDPLTGRPVILIEEEAVIKGIPEKWHSFLSGGYQDIDNPWPTLWNGNPELMKNLVYIPFQTIERRSWLLGVRPRQVRLLDSAIWREIPATVALVRQNLSPEGDYQALLHPEHSRKGVVNA